MQKQNETEQSKTLQGEGEGQKGNDARIVRVRESKKEKRTFNFTGHF